MSHYTCLQLTIENGVGVLTLNRPEKHNAFDQHMIAELIDCLQMIEHEKSVRVLMIAAAGRHFCAGADLTWMQRMADFSLDENKADARKLGLLLKTLAQLSKPTIALVQGRVMGGGIGLVACADIVIASNHSEFCFSEVKLGLVPATIAPYVVRRIGDSAARRYFLTAELFSATIAYDIKLVHEIVVNAELTATGMQLAKYIMQNAPDALSAAKNLLNELSPIDDTTIEKTADLLAHIRSSAECQEGIRAFLNKRKPNWSTHD